MWDREGQAAGVLRVRVWVLAKDNDAHVGRGEQFEGTVAHRGRRDGYAGRVGKRYVRFCARGEDG